MLSRRDLLRAGLLSGAAAALAACGASVPTSPPATPSPTLGATEPPSQSPSPRITAAPDSPSPTATATPPSGPTLREKIAGLIVVGFRGASLTDAPWVATALKEKHLRGVILFDRDQITGRQRNVLSPRQVTSLVRDLRAAASGREIVVSIDQEGGVVTRLSPAHGFPAVASEATIGRGTVAAARRWATALTATLASVDVNLNFAPVVDLNVNPHSPAIGALDRSFSADPDVVVRMATVQIEAHQERLIRSAIKHFPGIGSSTTNTDFGVADVTRTWTRRELEPFRRLIAGGPAASGTPDLVMAGHVVNGQLDRDHPASLSKSTVTGLLRGELGWNGIVVTDDLQAVAIQKAFGADEAVLLALEAGNDLLLFANQQVYDPGIVDRVIEVVAKAVESGRLPESRIDEAFERVDQIGRPLG